LRVRYRRRREGQERDEESSRSVGHARATCNRRTARAHAASDRMSAPVAAGARHLAVAAQPPPAVAEKGE